MIDTPNKNYLSNDVVIKGSIRFASRMTSGSNWRHLNSPQTEEARRSIRPAYHGVPAKLQHFQLSSRAIPAIYRAG
jgi:hypothetical protein